MDGLPVSARVVEVAPEMRAQMQLPPGTSVGKLALDVRASDGLTAVEYCRQALEALLDYLSFQLQSPVPVMQVQAIDVEPPLVCGEQRDMILISNYGRHKLASSTALGNIATVRVPELPAINGQLSSASQRSLDWYIKALSSPYDVDRFIFFWICVEVARSRNWSEDHRADSAPLRTRARTLPGVRRPYRPVPPSCELLHLRRGARPRQPSRPAAVEHAATCPRRQELRSLRSSTSSLSFCRCCTPLPLPSSRS